MRTTILVVDDDLTLCQQLKRFVERDGTFKVVVASNHEEGLLAFCQEEPELIILDIKLGTSGAEGLRLCRALQNLPSYKLRPRWLILLSGEYPTDLDQENGLLLGADDYWVKPINPQLLLLKLHIIRRRLLLDPPNVVRVNERVTIYLNHLEVLVEGQPISLRRRPFELLVYLASPPNTIRTYDEIADRLWKGSVAITTLQETIYQVRRAIELDPEQPTIIVNLYGVGYKLVTEDGNE